MVFSNVQFFGHMSGMLDSRPAFGHLPILRNTGSSALRPFLSGVSIRMTRRVDVRHRKDM